MKNNEDIADFEYRQMTLFDDIKPRKIPVTLHIEYDDFTESPREWDNLWKIYTWERRHSSPDSHNYHDPEYFLEDYNITKENLKNGENEDYLISPVYRYEHGNVIYSSGPFGCPWDSGQVGYAIVGKEEVTEWFGKYDKEHALDSLERELETYTDYANGNVFYAWTENKQTGEMIDSCGGFYPGPHALEDIKDQLDGTQEDQFDLSIDCEPYLG